MCGQQAGRRVHKNSTSSLTWPLCLHHLHTHPPTHVPLCLHTSPPLLLAQELRAPVELVRQTKALGRLPVVNFAAGGVATPADAALMMQLGMDGVFVGSGIFKSGDPAKRARAIVQVGAARSSGVLQQWGAGGRMPGVPAGWLPGTCSAG